MKSGKPSTRPHKKCILIMNCARLQPKNVRIRKGLRGSLFFWCVCRLESIDAHGGLPKLEGKIRPSHTVLGFACAAVPFALLTLPQILCACTSLDLRLTLCQSYLHSLLPCFSLMEFSAKCAAYETCYSAMISETQTEISGGQNVGLMPCGCAHVEFFEISLPWQESVLK